MKVEILEVVNCVGQGAVDLGAIAVIVMVFITMAVCVFAILEGIVGFVLDFFGNKVGIVVLAIFSVVVLLIYWSQK